MSRRWTAERNLILQQGFEEPSPQLCALHYKALTFQPRVVAVLLLVGIALQSPVYFGTLASVLGWSALAPRRNPFDALYNGTLGRRRGATRLVPAPAPRRFAQALAAAISLAIAVLLQRGSHLAAWVTEAILLLAAAALAFGSLCFGSFLFHAIRGRLRFALRTLPWAEGDAPR